MTLDLLTQPETYLSFLSLTAMEIVLGIDNVVFISILAGKLRRSVPGRQGHARDP
jgi:predicted tellurium resistance membrane protein TerC